MTVKEKLWPSGTVAGALIVAEGSGALRGRGCTSCGSANAGLSRRVTARGANAAEASGRASPAQAEANLSPPSGKRGAGAAACAAVTGPANCPARMLKTKKIA